MADRTRKRSFGRLRTRACDDLATRRATCRGDGLAHKDPFGLLVGVISCVELIGCRRQPRKCCVDDQEYHQPIGSLFLNLLL